MVDISKAFFRPIKKYVIFPIKEWRAVFDCDIPWIFVLTFFHQKAEGWRVYILLSNNIIALSDRKWRFYYSLIFRCLGSVSQIDFRNARFVSKIDILAKLLWDAGHYICNVLPVFQYSSTFCRIYWYKIISFYLWVVIISRFDLICKPILSFFFENSPCHKGWVA